jgi:hypothetical protein
MRDPVSKRKWEELDSASLGVKGFTAWRMGHGLFGFVREIKSEPK